MILIRPFIKFYVPYKVEKDHCYLLLPSSHKKKTKKNLMAKEVLGCMCMPSQTTEPFRLKSWTLLPLCQACGDSNLKFEHITNKIYPRLQ
jgi:hypothetical protein